MSTSPARPLPPMPELLAPLPLAAVALLAFNDHLAKAAWPGLVTGKLSDVAGCFVLPLLVSALLALLTRWSPARRLLLGAAVTTLLFTAIKLSPAAADIVATALGALGRLVGGGESRIVTDPTDLLALPFVGLAVTYGRHRARRPPSGAVPRALKLGALGTTVALLSATTMAPRCPPESGLLDGALTYRAETDCGPVGLVVLRVDRGLVSHPTCRATLDGGEQAGIGAEGIVYGKRIRVNALPPAGLELRPDQRVSKECIVTVDRGLDRLPIECETTLLGPGGPDGQELARCRGTLVRVPSAQAPAAARTP
jgi:hypothetical protein